MHKSGCAAPVITGRTFAISICTRRFAFRTAAADLEWDLLALPNILPGFCRENSFSILKPAKSFLATLNAESVRQLAMDQTIATAGEKSAMSPPRRWGARVFLPSHGCIDRKSVV